MTEPTALPARFGRNAAITVLGCVLLALGAIAIGPHLWNMHLSRLAEERTAAAQKLESDAKRLGASKQRLAALSNPEIAKVMLLQGSTAGLNGAQLQAQVAEIAARSGISPNSLRVSDPQNWQEGLRNITLEIGMRGSLKQLQSFLFDIETKMPLMFIETLTAAEPARGQSDISGTAALDISITIRGVALAELTP